MNNSSDIDYNGYKADTKCYTDFTLRDYYYLGSGYTAFGGEITYSFARLFKGRGSVFAAASGDYVRADDHRDLFDRRFYANFKIGLMFLELEPSGEDDTYPPRRVSNNCSI